MNRRQRKKIFKLYLAHIPDARATRCYRFWMINFTDSGYTLICFHERKHTRIKNGKQTSSSN
jgi:hypothetical protein